MILELKYIYECKGGFKYACDTPNEAKEHMEKDYKVLSELAKELGNCSFCDLLTDFTKEHFPSAKMTAFIDGVSKYYELRTESKIIK